MKPENDHVYPSHKAHRLESRWRYWLQNPYRLLRKYVKPGDKVMDLGCGSGYFSLPLANMVGSKGHVYAVDMQADMLSQVSEKLTRIQVAGPVSTILSSGEDVGITESVDFILAAYVMHEVPNQALFFQSLREKLKPGGQMFFMEPDFVVSKQAFKASLTKARQSGFTSITPVRALLSKAAILV